MIDIYDVEGNVLMQAEITSSAKREEELSKSDYISLSWNSTEKVILPVGAYINHTYKIDKVREVTRQFLLLEAYEPTQTDEMSWKYTPEFQHPKMILSKVPFYVRTRNSQDEEIKQHVWSFVGTMHTIAEQLQDFLNKEVKFGNAGWTVHYDETNSNTINVSFSDNDFISALSAIVNAIGDNCEWHIDYDNEIIHIGKVSDDKGKVVLKVGENVGVPSISNSKENFYNSFAVFGGTRNITQVNNKGENISSSDIRLQLDKGTGSVIIDGKAVSYTIDEYSTIDLRKDKAKEPQFTKVLDFSQIFPSLNTYVYNVRGREKYVLDENNEKIPLVFNSDGSVATYKTFTVWYMRLAYPTTEEVADKKLINTTIDDGVTHYWYDFEITDSLLVNSKNIGCSFEANFNKGALPSPLAGRGSNGNYVGFELTYHKEASSSHSSDDVSGNDFSVLAGDYEIVYQEDNGLIIPTNAVEMIVPKGEALPSLKCNITVLYNIVMADSIYIKDAQQRLFDAAIKEIQRLRSDLNNYTIKSYPQVFVEQNPYLQIGQKVTYDDGNGYTLSTRVLKLSTNIDYNFIQEITVGNQAIKGTITQLKDDVQSIIASGGGNGSGCGGYTESQLKNLIARYGTGYFLSKQFNDTAQGLITFAKGLISEMLAQLKGGATFGNSGYKFDENGNVVVDALSSLAFDEALERGFGIKKNAQGKYTLSVTDLMVWGKAVFNSLEIRKLYAVGGNVYLSGASSKIVRAVPVKKATAAASSTGGDASETWVACAEGDADCEGWKCYILNDDGTTATQNGWRKYDQAKCQTFDIKEGVYENVSNTYYWRLVTDVSTENETITETYTDADGKEQTRDLYDGKKFGWVVLSKTDCESTTNDAPKAGDTIVLDGHRMFASGDDDGRDQYNDESRTNVMMLETTGTEDGTLPRIVALTGIVDYRHWDGVNHYSNTVFILSPKEVVFVSSSFKFMSASGDPITLVNFRGNWAKETEYRYYDQVSHNDSIWTCIVKKGDTTNAEPSDTSTDWRKEISGEAGKNNYVHVAWSNKQNPTKDDIVLSNTDGNAYAYMGTWVSETKEDKADEAVNMAKWVYVKGDKGADGSAYDIYLSASVLKGDNTGKLNGNDTVSVTAKVVKITGGTAVQVTDTSEAYFTISRTDDRGDLIDWPSGMFTVKTFNAFGQGVKTWNFALYVGGTFLKTVMLPVVRDGKQGADGSAATVYTIEAVGNYNNNSGTLTDASTIGVTLTGDLKLYKTVGSEKTEDSKPPQCWRLTVGGENVDGMRVFDNNAGNNIVTYQYYNKYNIDSNGNSTVPGSATISVYRDSSMSELLASLVVPISLNPGAIVNVDAKLGKIESTTASMKNDMNGMQGTIETIKQGQGQISLKVQDLQNGGVDTSKPHTSSQVDFRTLDADSFYPVMIRFKDDGGVRHTVEISRNLDGTYGSGKDYMTHSQGFSFRLIFSDIANGWGTNEDGQLRIESISQRWTEPTDTPICPKIAQYYPFSFTLAWLRGGSKYDITVDCTDAYISGIWPYMMQVASNPSWVPDAVRLAPDTWTTAQVNAQGGNPYNMLRKDNGGYYTDVNNKYLYRFGELAAGNTFAIVGQPKDSKQWYMATWHITSVSGSKVYVDVSTYGLLWQTQNPLGIRMNGELGYIKTGVSYPKSKWDSQNEFGSSVDVDNTAVHADWGLTGAILVIGKESSTINGVHRDRAVLEAVQSYTEGSSVSFYSNTYFDVSPLYGTDGRTNVKPDLLATGIDIKSHKIVATADNFVVRNNSGTPTFSIDEEGNIVGSGGASFNGPMKATTFTLNSTYFSVKEDGTITAKGGRISFFNFDEEGMTSGVTLVSDSSQNKIAQRGLGLSSNNISVSGSANQRVSSVFWGNGHIDSRFAGSDKNYIVHRVGSTSLASTFYNYIKLEKLGNGSDSFENNPEHAALGIETQGDFCLAALGGPSLFAGMCFASNTGGSFVAADKKNCFYLCEGGRFYMPNDPPNGMLIVVIQTGGKITFYGNGHDFHSGTNSSGSCNSNAAGQWTLFYYDGNFWNTVYMNGRSW